MSRVLDALQRLEYLRTRTQRAERPMRVSTYSRDLLRRETALKELAKVESRASHIRAHARPLQLLVHFSSSSHPAFLLPSSPNDRF